jgi:two-component system sporulation sensor kinase C
MNPLEGAQERREVTETRPAAPTARWRRLWTASGWALIVMGGAAIIGWILTIRVLVQPIETRAPLRPAAALGLFALGVAALACDRGLRRTALVLGTTAAAIGLTGLLELVTGSSLGLDGLPLRPDLEALIGRPGSSQVPFSTAWGLILGGAGIVAVITGLKRPSGAFLVGVIASILGALGFALLLAQAIGFSPGVQFGPVVGSGPQAAIGLLLLGVAMGATAWTRDWTPATYPAWIPPAAGLASLTAVLFLWRAMIQGQDADARTLLAAAAERAETRVEEGIGLVNSALRRVAWFSFPSVVGTDEWNRSVQTMVNSVPGMTGIAWVDGNGSRALLVPVPEDSLTLITQLKLQVGSRSPPTLSRPDSVWHFSLADSAQTLGIAVPRCDLSTCDGFVVGLIRGDRLLLPMLADTVDGYHRTVSWRGRTIVTSGFGPARGHDLVHRAVMSVDEMAWEVVVWPTGGGSPAPGGGLSGLVLAFGLLLSGLLPVSLQLGRTLQTNARTAELARLQLLLGRSMDRAWSWEVPARADGEPALESSTRGQELRKGRWTELVHPDDRRRVEALLSAHLDGWSHVFEAQYRIQDAAGEWSWRVDRGHVTERGPYGTPLQMLGVSGDVSERRRVDEERERSERRFRAMFDSAYQFQALLDLECRILEANPTALELLRNETSIEGLRGLVFWEAGWWSGPDAAAWAKTACDAAKAGRIVKQELEMATRGGQRVVMDFSVKAIRDAEGRVAQLLVEGRDITARRRAEAELREVETLTTMGRIAARVAHEINNPLAGIQNSFLLLRDAIPADHPHYAYVGAIEREIRRIADVTRQLYETYRPDSDGTGQSGVRTLIGDAVAFLQQVNRPTQVRIQAELAGVPSLVAIPESVLRQSVYNLVQNAVEASPPGGLVTVWAHAENGYFVLRVRDQGPGVPASARSRIFEPFVTTKGRGAATGGMGIGLSLVRRSVEAMGGTIDIEDPPDGGAEFVIRIPVAQATNGGNS